MSNATWARWSVLALGAIGLVACGGSGGGGGGGSTVTLVSFSPNSDLGGDSTPYTLTGTDFRSALGGTARITWRALDGATPFEHGTMDRATTLASVTSDTTIVGVTPNALLCGVRSVSVEIDAELADGATATSAGVFEIRMHAPTIVSLAPNALPAASATPFTITGTGFPVTGGPVTIRFTGDGGALLFGDGTTPQVDVPGLVTSPTTIAATSPVATVCGVEAVSLGQLGASLELSFPDGCCTLPTTSGFVTFLAPEIASLAPSSIPAEGPPQALVLTGSHFGPPNTIATVRFVADGGEGLFGSGTLPTIEVPGLIGPTAFPAAQTITLTSPTAVVCGVTSRSATIRVISPYGGSCRQSAPGFVTFTAPALTSISATDVPSLTPTDVTITGSGFGVAIGTIVTVRLTADAAGGTPYVFEGGAAQATDVTGTVASATTISFRSPPATLCGQASHVANVKVVFANGTCASGVSLLFDGPTATAFVPLTVPAATSMRFTIVGMGFAPSGATTEVRFQARAGAPFGGSASASVVGTITSSTTIEGGTPTASSGAAFDCDVVATFEDGTCVATDPSLVTIRFVPDSPRFAYVANEMDGTVSIYRVDGTAGQLRHAGYVIAGTRPRAVTVDPSGRFVYVLNYGSNDMTTFGINPSTGALSEVGTEVPVGNGPLSVTVDPSGRFVYVANTASNDVTTFVINQSTGALSEVGTEVAAGGNPFSITVDASGRFAYVANAGSGNVTTFSIEFTTGALTEVGTEVAAGTHPRSVTVDPSGRFAYVANSGSDNVTAFRIDPTTGVLTEVGSEVSAGIAPWMVAVDPSGRFAYVANFNSDDITTFTVDQSSGALTVLGTDVAVGAHPYAVAVDPSGRFVYTTNSGSNDLSMFGIDAVTGALTAFGVVSARAGPYGLAMTPGAAAPVTVVPKFAYVANDGSGNVTSFHVDATSGVLTEIGAEIATGTYARSVTADPLGRFVYVANFGSDNVTTFRIDQATGALTEVGAEVAAGNGPWSITVDPSGRFAYVANYDSSGVTTFRIDQTTGGLTRVGGDVATGTQPRGVAVDPSGRFAYVANLWTDNVTTFSINPTTGALTEVGTEVAAGAWPHSVTVDPTGRFVYVANYTSNNVTTFRIHSATGALTEVGTEVAAGTQPRSLAVDPSGRFAYAASSGSQDVTTFRIDSTTGALTEVGARAVAGAGTWAVTVDPSGRFVYVGNYASNDVTTFSIDVTTGVLTELGSEVPAGQRPHSVFVVGGP